MSHPTHALKVSWTDENLSVCGHGFPQIDVNYLEAFCRPASQDRDWAETVIPHRTVLLSEQDAGTPLELETTLDDGVVVRHTITSGSDEVDFRLSAHNPTSVESDAHWAQPCIRVGAFTGSSDAEDPYDYIRKCFIFLFGRLATMPTPSWTTSGLYTPGQVWCPVSVPRADVNPRPLNSLPPSNGLIGCFSGDESMILATAWEPYQELFQGVLQCIHSDFRIGGLRPRERKSIRGKLYIVDNDIDALLLRYGNDFPEHHSSESDVSERNPMERTRQSVEPTSAL